MTSQKNTPDLMAIFFNNDGDRHAEWHQALTQLFPDRAIYEFPHIPDPSEIEYAIVWNHPPGGLARYPNLKAVLSTGSGTEHFDRDENLPDVPIVRLIDPSMADDMALYALYWVLHFQRKFGTYRGQQDVMHWERYPSPKPENFRLCILGLGAIGQVIARRLTANGFAVTGWSRSPKSIEGVTCLSGQSALNGAMKDTDVLINCLPLLPATRGFVDAGKLQTLPRGAHVINISRGPIIDEAALLACLDSGHIESAALDVFGKEPLPVSSPFWTHARVHVTPHMSGATNPQSAAKIIAGSIAALERGDMPPYLYRRGA